MNIANLPQGYRIVGRLDGAQELQKQKRAWWWPWRTSWSAIATARGSVPRGCVILTSLAHKDASRNVKEARA